MINFLSNSSFLRFFFVVQLDFFSRSLRNCKLFLFFSSQKVKKISISPSPSIRRSSSWSYCHSEFIRPCSPYWCAVQKIVLYFQFKKFTGICTFQTQVGLCAADTARSVKSDSFFTVFNKVGHNSAVQISAFPIPLLSIIFFLHKLKQNLKQIQYTLSFYHLNRPRNGKPILLYCTQPVFLYKTSRAKLLRVKLSVKFKKILKLS